MAKTCSFHFFSNVSYGGFHEFFSNSTSANFKIVLSFHMKPFIQKVDWFKAPLRDWNFWGKVDWKSTFTIFFLEKFFLKNKVCLRIFLFFTTFETFLGIFGRFYLVLTVKGQRHIFFTTLLPYKTKSCYSWVHYQRK